MIFLRYTNLARIEKSTSTGFKQNPFSNFIGIGKLMHEPSDFTRFRLCEAA